MIFLTPTIEIFMTRSVYFVILLTFIGCSGKDVVACTKQTQTVDAVYGDNFYDFDLGLVKAFKDKGWSCDSAPLRNAFGTEIGTHYTCSGC